MDLTNTVYELIVKTSTTLPDDVLTALEAAGRLEDGDSPGGKTLSTIVENVKLAGEKKTPLCQDTGNVIFYVKKPAGLSEAGIKSAIIDAVGNATENNVLRPNAVDPASGKNSGDNTGEGAPQIHFEEWIREGVRVDLLLKGGGSENTSAQYKLPDEKLGAGRDLDGVRKCALDAVYNAQGKGCPPGILAVAIGGDRAEGYSAAKRLLFREIGERNRVKKLAEVEERILFEANQLGIGPAGLGGKTTLLDVKVGVLARHPASFFVTVAYGCWALRRGGIDFRTGCCLI